MWTDLYVTLCLGCPEPSPAQLLAFGQCSGLSDLLGGDGLGLAPLAAAVEDILGRLLLRRDPAMRSHIGAVIASFEDAFSNFFLSTTNGTDRERTHSTRTAGYVTLPSDDNRAGILPPLTALVTLERSLHCNSNNSSRPSSVILNMGYLRLYSPPSPTRWRGEDVAVVACSLTHLSIYATRNLLKCAREYHLLSVGPIPEKTMAPLRSSGIGSHSSLSVDTEDVSSTIYSSLVGRYRLCLADCTEKMSNGLCIIVSVDNDSSSSTLSTDVLSCTVATALCERLWALDSPASLMATAPSAYVHCDKVLLEMLRLS